MTDMMGLKEEVRRIIGECSGTASVCWTEAPDGIFDATTCEKYVGEATEAILSLIAREVEEKDKRLDELYKEVSYFRDRRCIQLEKEIEGKDTLLAKEIDEKWGLKTKIQRLKDEAEVGWVNRCKEVAKLKEYYMARLAEGRKHEK